MTNFLKTPGYVNPSYTGDTVTNVSNGRTLYAKWTSNRLYPDDEPQKVSEARSSPANRGTSTILSATIEPTVSTTVEPTAVPPASTRDPDHLPVAQPTQKSPAPLAGILAGLGAVLVIARLRK